MKRPSDEASESSKRRKLRLCGSTSSSPLNGHDVDETVAVTVTNIAGDLLVSHRLPKEHLMFEIMSHLQNPIILLHNDTASFQSCPVQYRAHRDDVPKFGANLVAALAILDVHELAHDA